jgi:hypothetical protein
MLQPFLFAALLFLAALAAGWYVVSLQAMLRTMNSSTISAMNERQRAAYMQSPEYARLREGVRRPIFAATILVALLFLVSKLPL